MQQRKHCKSNTKKPRYKARIRRAEKGAINLDKKKLFVKGMKDGIPIFLGYLSVSFGFGILAVKSGISAFFATLISLTNLTSAGQAAGVLIIASGGTIIEMILTQAVINVRYSLMAISLSQKLSEDFTVPKRLLVSYGITDEIFAVAASKPFLVTPEYMGGLISVSTVGWCAGTALGAVAGNLMPEAVTNAMGILLYGMFLAIIIPAARKELRILCVISVAAAVSLVFKFLLPVVDGGFAIIISAVAASVFGALVFPRKEENDGQNADNQSGGQGAKQTKEGQNV